MNDKMENLKEMAADAVERMKVAGSNIADTVKASNAGKSVLGEDGKFGKDDMERLNENFKNSGIGKSLLGEDGKFDKDDLSRIGGQVKDAAASAADTVKGMFKKD